MKLPGFARAVLAAAGLLCAATVQADVFTYQPKTVAAGGTGNHHESFIGTDGGAAGSGATIGYIGAGYGGGYQYEYLVQFDQLSRWIGGTEAVTNAQLKLQFYYPPTSTDPVTPPSLDVYRVTNSWQNGATWSSRGGALGTWNTPGGDFDPIPAASIVYPTAPSTFTIQTWDVTGLVSNWVVGTQPHYGMLVKWTPSTSSDFIRFWFFAGPNGPAVSGSFIAPSLTIYTIPEPSGLILAGLGMAWLRWRKQGFRR